MINPYYFFFYLLYIKLHQYAKEPERIPFSLATFMFLILAVHIVFLGKQIYWCFNIIIVPEMDKAVFGWSLALSWITLNYFLFTRNDRYIKIVENIKNQQYYKKVIAFSILLLYMLLPLFLYIYRKYQ